MHLRRNTLVNVIKRASYLAVSALTVNIYSVPFCLERVCSLPPPGPPAHSSLPSRHASPIHSYPFHCPAQEGENLCVVMHTKRVKAPRSQISICFYTYNESKDSRRTWGSQFSLKGKTDRHGYGLFVDKQRLKGSSVFQGLEGRENTVPPPSSPLPNLFPWPK